MKEELTAGGKEFIFALIGAAALYLACGVIAALCSSFNYSFIGGIVSVLIFASYGFFVLTRYTARFTYQLSGGTLRINRTIGKRNKEVELQCADIIHMNYGFQPSGFPKRPYNMRKSIISKKKLLFIEYRDKNGETHGVIIEPSEKLRKKIERTKNKSI